ncbi:MAG: TAXI family TRAP transporter solute-binding subunit [Ectothiorhodospiraceae bacterium]|nr:TAXI family TRAP transporter solute-binding subunit [Ectothiorhodospiraceae bacterium]
MNRNTVYRAVGLAAAGLLIAAGTFASTAQAQQRFTTIGTGGVTGVYYPTGGAICSLVNRGRSEHGIRCSAESTAGSIYNLNALAEGDLEFGVVQSDWQYHAYNGSDQFADQGPNEDLRAVFSLHPEPFTVVVRPDAEIASFDEIKGKRVNVGNPGSGQRGTVERLMDVYGWTMRDFSLASELPSREQSAALCDNRIDVVLFTVGHPSGSIQEPIATCDARLVPVTGERVDRLVEETPYYFHATIPGGMYPNHDADVETFGVGATFVTRADVPEEVVYQVTRAVFENLDTFKGLHPAFGVLEADVMISEGLSAPLHEGAKRYFREAGLLGD